MKRKQIKEACKFGGIQSIKDEQPSPPYYENLKKDAEQLNKEKPFWKVILNPFREFKIASDFTHLIAVQANAEDGGYWDVITFYFVNFE